MKRQLISTVLLGAIATVIVTMTAVVVSTGSARADGTTMHNPTSGTLNANCAGCHRIHTSSHENLLRQSDVVALCLTCHGAAGTGSDLNVDLGKTNSAGGALLAGGFQETVWNTADPTGANLVVTPVGGAHIGVAGASAPVTSNHTLGDNKPIWGNAGGWSTNLAEFTCANCHDPHGGSDSGNPTYRILRVKPTGSGAAANAVVTDEGATKHYSSTDWYNPRALLLNPATPSSNPVPSLASLASGGISAWCAQCHTAYFQNSFPGETPNGTVGSFTGNFMHKAGDISTSSGSATSITCVKCHAGHGTSATMSDAKNTTGATGVVYPDGTLAAAGQDSRLLKMNDRGICRKCHRDK